MKMYDIVPSVISRRISLNPYCKPVRHKRWSYDVESYEALKVEVDNFMAIRFIMKLNYPKWVTNVVMIKKTGEAERPIK